ncbi:MAG: glycosyltransferase [Oscillospiraceae bacterium]
MSINKIALIVTARGGFINGFLLHDLEILKDLGYEVHCCANDNGKGYIENVLKERHVYFHQIDFESKNPLKKDNITAFKQIRKIIKNLKPDLIHCHTAIAGAITRFANKTILGNKAYMIYTTHGFNFHKYSSKKSWIMYYTIEKIMSLITDTIITINNEDYSNAKRMFCKDVKMINGVGVNLKKFDISDFDRKKYRSSLGINDNDLFVLSVGELSERKNHQVIIKAIAQSGLKNVVYGIAGGGIPGSSTYNKLVELAKEFDVKLILFGFRNDIPQLCHCADIGAIPSVQEGLGLSGIEQLRCGVPLVGSNVQGIKDYIIDNGTDGNGFIYNPYDVNGFSEGLKKLSNSELREKMAVFCHDSVEKFDCSVSYKQMTDIYQQIDKEIMESKRK